MATTLESLILELEVVGAQQVMTELQHVAMQVAQIGSVARVSGQAVAQMTRSLSSMAKMTKAAQGPSLPSMPSLPAMAKMANAPAASLPAALSGAGGSGGGIAGGLLNLLKGAGGGGGGIGALAGIAGPVGIALMAFQQIAHIAMQIVQTFEHFWKEALSFAKEFLAIKSMTGATDRAAIGIQNRFSAAGLPAQMAERVTERIEMGAKTAKGQAAFMRLHINPTGKDGAQLVNETFQAIAKLPDGMKKLRIETDLLGARLAIGVQAVFRYSEAQQANLNALQNAFSGDGARAIVEAQKSFEILGMTLMQRIVYPIMAEVAPVLEAFADKIAQLVNWYADLDKAMGGGLGKEITLIAGLAGTVLLSVANNIGMLAMALDILLKPLQMVLQLIEGAIKSLGLDKALKDMGINMSADRYKDPNSDRTARAAERTADNIESLHGTIKGGLSGERGNITKTNMELEFAIAKAMVG